MREVKVWGGFFKSRGSSGGFCEVYPKLYFFRKNYTNFSNYHYIVNMALKLHVLMSPLSYQKMSMNPPKASKKTKKPKKNFNKER
jgi:hypothetical protein